MPRRLDDIPTGSNWPPAGEYACRCMLVEAGSSARKQTPFVSLTWQTEDAEYVFNDDIYVTPKTLKRLVLVAKRVCNAADEMELPDDDGQAAKDLARFIYDNAQGKRCMVEVVEYIEKYMPESGDNMGVLQEVKKHRVSFNGYNRIPVKTDVPAENTEGDDGVDPDGGPTAEELAADVNASGDNLPF